MDLRTLQDVRLRGTDGGEHRLGDLWAEHAVVLVFLRHFG